MKIKILSINVDNVLINGNREKALTYLYFVEALAREKNYPFSFISISPRCFISMIDKIAGAALESKSFTFEDMVAKMREQSLFPTKKFLEGHGIKNPLFLLKNENKELKKENFAKEEKIVEAFIKFFATSVSQKSAFQGLDVILRDVFRRFLENLKIVPYIPITLQDAIFSIPLTLRYRQVAQSPKLEIQAVFLRFGSIATWR